MHVTFMQKVDYWAGIPICIALTIIHKLRTLFSPPVKSDPRKILFLELSEMGSAILAYSSLMKAKELFREEDIYFLIFERNRESVDLLDVLPKENILVIKDKNFIQFAVSTLSALFKIRKLKIDTILDLELFSRFTAILSYLTGARNRVGFYNYQDEGLYRGDLLTRKVQYNYTQHIALNFLNLFFSLTVPEEQIPLLKINVKNALRELPYITVTDEEKEGIRLKLKSENPSYDEGSPLVILNPDPGLLPLRGWPVEKYVQLAEKLRAHASVNLVVIGLERSKQYSQAISKNFPKERIIDLTGKTETLREVLGLFSISQLLITSDSGPAHVASLTPIDNFVLFGPETPLRYSPLGSRTKSFYAGLSCSPCYSAANHRKSVCRDNQCMKDIPVDDIYEEVRKLPFLS